MLQSMNHQSQSLDHNFTDKSSNVSRTKELVEKAFEYYMETHPPLVAD